MEIQVIKRDGTREDLNIDKLHKVIFWATEGLSGVSASEVELRSQIQFQNKMKTTDIQEVMIKSAADLISEESPNYQYVAGRLVNYQLRKEVYGRFQPTRLFDLIKKNIKSGFYDKNLLELYSEEEWDEINSFVNHERDMGLTYVAMEQMRGKYLVQSRVTKKILETPQVLYILVAAVLFAKYPAETRIKWVRDYYDAISKHEISLPTPIMAGVRTPQRQFSSCVLIETDDSLDSITATSSAIVKYVSQRAGIGIGAGSIRALGSPVRAGDTSHTGVTPFFKHFQTAVNSCSQGGVRKGSASLYYPIWHLEVETMLVLKNNKGIEENRIRGLDYGVQFSKLFYERFLTNGNITLFSPSDVPGLYEAFFSDQARFKELYEAAEANSKITRKKTVKAHDLFTMFAQERKDTGRIYLMNVDHANTHSAFDESVAAVRMSNLCAEITLPTKPLEHLHDENGEIALCTLSAVNMGIVGERDMERVTRLAVAGLDNLLDYQEYPVRAAQIATMNRRPIGVGVINFAYFLAKNGVKYSDGSALDIVDRWFECWSYNLIKASNELAIEKGACPKSHETKYGKGILPIDTRKREVDELVPHRERFDWEGLRTSLREHGIRNSTLMALMPAETSAQIANATNGIEPPRAFISIKQSKQGVLKQVVPGFPKIKNKYELLWDQQSPIGYLQLCAVMQKYVDQSISVNTSYNPKFYAEEKVTMTDLIGHILLAYKWGLKTLYYNNTNDLQSEIDVDELTASVQKKMAVPALVEETCDSCSI